MQDQDTQHPGETLVLRLYVAGSAPNSTLARANLKALCEEYPGIRYQLEIIDVLVDPQRAVQDNILVTPTLVLVSSLRVEIRGNLSDRAQVLALLGLQP